MTEILLDGLFYAAVTSVLALSSREFGFYNLAAGVWLILGGWIAALVVAAVTPATVPMNAAVVPVFCILLAIQLTSPRLLRRRLQRNPLVYLFVSLGVALAGSTIGTALLLDSHGATIPLAMDAGPILLMPVAFLCIAGSWLIFRTGTWAKLAIRFRADSPGAGVWSDLSVLLGLEAVLLLILGAAGYSVHKGIFDAAELYTIIPLLALIVTGARVPQASLLSFVLVSASHGLDAAFPRYAQYSIAIVIAVLLVIVATITRPKNALLAARPVDYLPARTDQEFWARHPYVSSGACLFVLIACGLWLVGSSAAALHQMMWVMVLITLSWIGQAHMGVRTIIWPAIGITTAYLIVSLSDRSLFLVVLALAAAMAMWAFYLWWLRILREESAMVVDLGVLVLIHHVVLGFAALSGADNIRHFRLPFPLLISRGEILLILAAVVVGLLGVVYVAGRTHWLRGAALALANLRLGFQHGFPSRALFVGSAAVLVGIAIGATIVHLVGFPALTPTDLSLVLGLTVLAFGFITTRAGAVVAFPLVFTLYVVVDFLGGGFGIYSNALVGGLFIVLALVPNAGGADVGARA